MRQRTAGFTLVEVVLAAAITSVVLVGMQSAMLVASHAAPSRTGVSSLTMRCGSATDQLAADLAYAKSFNTTTSNAVEMIVPDRTGDGLSDTIRYSWSGVSGASLLRSFNGGTATQVVTDVRQFTLGYVTAATKLATSYTESAETLLFCSDGGTAYQYPSVSSKIGVAQGCTPSIPSSASYWRVTRVKFPARGTSLFNSSEMQVQLRVSTSPYSMQNTVSDFAKAYTQSAYLYYWLEASFSNNARIAPGKSIGLVFLHSADGLDFYIPCRTDANFANAAYCYSTDTGSSWSADASKAIPLYVYGVVATTNPDSYQYNLTHVACLLKAGDSATTQIHSDFRVLNQPQVSGP